MKRWSFGAALAQAMGLCLAAHAGDPDLLLLTNTEFDGAQTGIKQLDPTTGAIIGEFVPEDFHNNGELWPIEAIAPGPDRSVLVAQPCPDGKISRYDDQGEFIGVYLGNTAKDNPVDNIRGMVRSLDGQYLFTADWDDDDVHRFRFVDGAPAGIDPNDPLGIFIPGMQPPPLLDLPQAMAVLPDGALLVADMAQGKLLRYDPSTGALIGPFHQEFLAGNIHDIDVQANGDVVVANGGSGDRVITFNFAGVIISEFNFNEPQGVHVLPSGDLLVTSGSTFGQGKGLFRVSSDGTILEVLDDSRSYGALELITLVRVSGDCEGADGDVDLLDHAQIALCLTGPGGALLSGCGCADADFDGDVDMFDVALVFARFGGG